MKIVDVGKKVDASTLTGRGGTNLVSRRMLRKVVGGFGVVGGVIFLSGLYHGVLLATVSVAALFLGVTDFGRQCPLILSLRHLLYRFKTRQ